MTRRLLLPGLASSLATCGALALVVTAAGQAPAPSPARVGGRTAQEIAAGQAKLAAEALKAVEFEASEAKLSPFDPVANAWHRRLAEAKVALARTPAERAAAIEPYVAHLHKCVEANEVKFKAGTRTMLDVLEARYEALEAERWQAVEGSR